MHACIHIYIYVCVCGNMEGLCVTFQMHIQHILATCTYQRVRIMVLTIKLKNDKKILKNMPFTKRNYWS